MSGNPNVPTATGDGWCGWSSPATGDGWPVHGQTITGDGACPIQTGKRKRGRVPRPVYLEPRAPAPITPPYVPEPWVNPPALALTRDASALMATHDRSREALERTMALAKARRRAQNRRALELLLMDD